MQIGEIRRMGNDVVEVMAIGVRGLVTIHGGKYSGQVPAAHLGAELTGDELDELGFGFDELLDDEPGEDDGLDGAIEDRDTHGEDTAVDLELPPAGPGAALAAAAGITVTPPQVKSQPTVVNNASGSPNAVTSGVPRQSGPVAASVTPAAPRPGDAPAGTTVAPPVTRTEE